MLALLPFCSVHVCECGILCSHPHHITKIVRVWIIFDKHNLSNSRVLNEPRAHLARGSVNVERCPIYRNPPRAACIIAFASAWTLTQSSYLSPFGIFKRSRSQPMFRQCGSLRAAPL